MDTNLPIEFAGKQPGLFCEAAVLRHTVLKQGWSQPVYALSYGAVAAGLNIQGSWVGDTPDRRSG